MKKRIDVLKLVGFLGTTLGLAATLVTNYANEKQLNKTVEEKVAEALANQTK